MAARIDAATLQTGHRAYPMRLGALGDRGAAGLDRDVLDGVLALDRAGALDRDRRWPPRSCSARELYEWVDGNPRVRMVRTEVTNDPGRIAQQPHGCSVNSALEVDLFAQANASQINARIHSGFGGQTDFIVGALHAPGGRRSSRCGRGTPRPTAPRSCPCS